MTNQLRREEYDDDAMGEASAARGAYRERNRFVFETRDWNKMIAAARRLHVYVINNNDGTVTLSPMNKKRETIVANLSPKDAIHFLDYVYQQKR